MDAVGAADAEGVALLEGAAEADLAELLHVLEDDVGRLDELVAQGGVAEVGAGHTEMDPAARLGLPLRHVAVDVLAHVGEERNDIVVGDRLDGVDLLLVEVGVLADPRRLLAGDADLTHLGVRLAGEDLDLLPDAVLVLEREDVAHLGTGVAVDHESSFDDAVRLPVPFEYTLSARMCRYPRQSHMHGHLRGHRPSRWVHIRFSEPDTESVFGGGPAPSASRKPGRRATICRQTVLPDRFQVPGRRRCMRSTLFSFDLKRTKRSFRTKRYLFFGLGSR